MPRRPPDPVRPPSALRAALWRARWRARVAVQSRRRLIASLLVGVSVASGLAAVRAPAAAPPSVRVTVAAHDLLPGDQLSATDLRTTSLPRSAAPRGALPVAALLGRIVAAPVLAGEPVPEVRLAGAGLAAAAGGDRVAVPVRLPDDLASLLPIGAVVDLVVPATAAAGFGDVGTGASTRPPGGASVIARGARVLAPAPEGTRADGLLSAAGGSEPLLVLAVAVDEAAGVAAASAQGVLWPVLRAADQAS